MQCKISTVLVSIPQHQILSIVKDAVKDKEADISTGKGLFLEGKCVHWNSL